MISPKHLISLAMGLIMALVAAMMAVEGAAPEAPPPTAGPADAGATPPDGQTPAVQADDTAVRLKQLEDAAIAKDKENAQLKLQVAAQKHAKALGVPDATPLLALVPAADLVYDDNGVPTNLLEQLTAQRDLMRAAVGGPTGGGSTRPAPAAVQGTGRIESLFDPGVFGPMPKTPA